MAAKKTQAVVRKDWFVDGNFFEKSLAVFGYAFAGYFIVAVCFGAIVGLLSLIVS